MPSLFRSFARCLLPSLAAMADMIAVLPFSYLQTPPMLPPRPPEGR